MRKNIAMVAVTLVVIAFFDWRSGRFEVGKDVAIIVALLGFIVLFDWQPGFIGRFYRERAKKR